MYTLYSYLNMKPEISSFSLRNSQFFLKLKRMHFTSPHVIVIALHGVKNGADCVMTLRADTKEFSTAK